MSASAAYRARPRLLGLDSPPERSAKVLCEAFHKAFPRKRPQVPLSMSRTAGQARFSAEEDQKRRSSLPTGHSCMAGPEAARPGTVPGTAPSTGDLVIASGHASHDDLPAAAATRTARPEGRTSIFWVTRLRLPLALRGVEELVLSAPS